MSQPRPHLGLPALVLFGLAYLAPLIVLGTFGVVAQASHGATAGSYVLALAAMLFTAASYGRMAALHPVAGSAYAYVCHAIDRRVGFMVGWAVTLDYLFLPMVIWLIGAAYLHDSFPALPMPALVLGFICITTFLNILGFRLAKGVNGLLMAVQAVVIVLFVALAAAFVGHGGPLLQSQPFMNPASGIGAIAAGAAIAAYSFLGFDAVTTLAEECHEPRRLLPGAIWLTALVGGAIFVIVSYIAQLAHPGFAFHDPAAAANEIARAIGGRWFEGLFLAGLVVAQFASGIAAQAAGARLIHAMARDGVLPRRLLGRLHPRFGTPAAAVLLTGVIGLLALGLTVESSTSFINFGAFTAFSAVNLSVIATAIRQGRRGILGWYLAPAAGMGVDMWLLTRLEPAAIHLGLAWLAVGLVVLAWLTRGFRRPPPALHMEEH
ncbi:MAG TPA: APC family permease [Novosphingobium sp.]|nr:APC family permease [Novosphingobium sp.]